MLIINGCHKLLTVVSVLMNGARFASQTVPSAADAGTGAIDETEL